VAVDLVEVDVVGAQPAEAGVALRHDVHAREPDLVRPVAHPAAHLRGHDDIRPPHAERGAEHFFRPADRVDVGGVEEVDAGVQRPMDECVRLLLAEGADRLEHADAPERHGAKTELRDIDAGVREKTMFH